MPMTIEKISKYILYNFHIYLMYTCIRLLLHKNCLHVQDTICGCIKDMYGKSQLWNIQAEHSWRFCKNVLQQQQRFGCTKKMSARYWQFAGGAVEVCLVGFPVVVQPFVGPRGSRNDVLSPPNLRVPFQSSSFVSSLKNSHFIKCHLCCFVVQKCLIYMQNILLVLMLYVLMPT